MASYAGKAPIDVLVKFKERVRDKLLTGEIIVRVELACPCKAFCYSTFHRNGTFFFSKLLNGSRSSARTELICAYKKLSPKNFSASYWS